MALISWTVGSSGAWTDASNWSPAQVPGAQDDAVIAASGSYLVNVAGATVNNITLNDASGTLLSSGVLTINHALLIDAGTLDIATGTVLVAGSLSNAGTIIDTGALELFGGYDDASLERIGGTGGTLALGGSLDNTGGTLNGAGFSNLSINSFGTIHGGTVVGIRQPGGGTLDGVTWQGTFDVENIFISIENSLQMTGANGTGPGTIIFNGGTLAFAGVQTLDNIDLDGSGQFNVGSGLTLGSGFRVNVANFGLLTMVGTLPGDGNLSNGGTIDVIGQPVFSGDQGVQAFISVGNFENTGTVEITGSGGRTNDAYINITSGTFTNEVGGLLGAFGGRLDSATSSVLVNNGTIVTNAGSVNIDGQLLGTGWIDVANGASVHFAGAVAATQTIDLSGTVNLTIDQPAFFAAGIDGLAVGDTITLGVSATALSYSDGDLKLAIGNSQTMDLAVFGPYGIGNFVVVASNGSTAIQVNGTSATAPMLSGTNHAVRYVTGGSPVVVAAGLTISDAGSPVLIGATGAITGGSFNGDGDQLSANVTGSPIQAKFDSMTGVLTLSGSDTLADYQRVLSSVTFGSSAADPTDGTSQPNRTITWIVNDGSAASAPATGTIEIQPPARILTWTGSQDGNFANAANWDDVSNALNPANLAPDGADTAQLLGDGGAISGTAVVGSLIFGGTVGWAVNGPSSLDVQAGVTVGSGATLHGGATIVSLGSVDIVSGAGGGSASLSVDDSGTLWTSLGTLVVGQQGSAGTLNIQNQGALSADGLVIARQTGMGAVIVSGDASLRDNSGVFVVGAGGLGSLLITSGGSVFTSGGDAAIAAASGTDGSDVNVSGSASVWRVAGALDVGEAAFGSLAIDSGGTVIATNADAGVQSTGAGVISVVGTGSNLSLSGQLIVGDASAGELSILSGATVAVSSANIGVSAGATGNVDLEGAGSLLQLGNMLNLGTGGAGVLTVGAGAELLATNAITIGSHGVLNQFGGTISPASLTIQVGGAAGGQGDDSYAGGGFNSGVLLASGTLTVSTPLLASVGAGQSGVIEIKHDGDMVLNAASVAASQTVAFDDGTGGLTIGSLAGFAATIGNFFAGDTILVDDVSIASQSFDPATHVLTLFNAANAPTGTLRFGSSINNLTGLTVSGSVPCFVNGTRISTERGEVPVEKLQIGDCVQTMGGSQPIIWIGHRTIDCVRHPEPMMVWPVRIVAGTFGPARPARDLWLSPDHAVYIGEVLIPAKCLINDTTIVQVPVKQVTYYHVELPHHAVLLAEGLPAESYLETGDRPNFANGGGPMARNPDFSSRCWDADACAPLVVTGAELAAARRWVDGIACCARLAA